LEGGSLSVRFSGLFDLFVDSNIIVIEMRRSGWGVEDRGWRWEEETFLLGRRAGCGMLFFVRKYCFEGINFEYLVLET